MEKIKVGFITMTHGIRGELKFYTDFSRKDLILKPEFPIYIEEELHHLSSVRAHKNHYLITIDQIKDINEVENFRGKDVFVSLCDIPLKKEEVLLESLLGFEIVEKEETLGKVTDIMYNGSGVLLKVSGIKNFYIPYEDYFIQRILGEEKKIITVHAKDLIL